MSVGAHQIGQYICRHDLCDILPEMLEKLRTIAASDESSWLLLPMTLAKLYTFLLQELDSILQ